jgi:hypothetical protein
MSLLTKDCAHGINIFGEDSNAVQRVRVCYDAVTDDGSATCKTRPPAYLAARRQTHRLIMP